MRLILLWICLFPLLEAGAQVTNKTPQATQPDLQKGNPKIAPAPISGPGVTTPATAPGGNTHPGQPASSAVKQGKGVKKPMINWEAPRDWGLLNGEQKKVLYFDGAAYAPNFLPEYNKRIPLSGTENSATAILLKQVFEPLEASSLTLIDKKLLKAEVTPHVLVTYDRGSPVAEVTFIPLRINALSGQVEKLISFELKLNPAVDQSRRPVTVSSRSFATTSVLATGTWFRLGLTATSVYKLSYRYLKNLGIDVKNLNPQNFKVYGNGGGMLPFSNAIARKDDLVQDAIYFSGGNSKTTMDTTDYFLFYGVSPSTWSHTTSGSSCTAFNHQLNKYSDTTFYFVTPDAPGTSKRIPLQASSVAVPNKTVSTFDDYGFVENDAENLISSGREWYGEAFDVITTYTYPFNFPNIDVTAPVTVTADLIARNDRDTYNSSNGSPLNLDSVFFNISCQAASSNFSVPNVSFSTYWGDYALERAGCISFLPSSPALNVTVTKTSPTPSLGWMNYVEVNVRRKLQMAGSTMLFRDSHSAGSGNVSQFTVGNMLPRVLIWDVTDLTNVALQQVTYSGSTAQFTVPTDSIREFMAFDTTAAMNVPVNFGLVPNQDLHATAQTDFIIVSHPDFVSEATRLANIHATRDNLTAVVVTPQQIYNEFSCGRQDVVAIRDFVRMLYKRFPSATAMPKYLLLFGDGSYDPKHRLPGNTNFIVAFENTDPSGPLNESDSYVSDEFFGLLDDTEGPWDSAGDAGNIDIGIGRFPVRDLGSAKTLVDKVEKYMSLGSPPAISGCNLQNCSVMRDWRNIVCFMADDGDGDTHVIQAEQLATMVDTGYVNYNIDKIYIDSYQEITTPGGGRYPSVEDAINKRVEQGALIMNYTGHGGPSGLSHKRIVELAQINAWNNLCNMPFFVTATCEFAQYDDPSFVSAGESVLMNPNGAGIGLLTTVRLVFSTPNFYLNQNFYKCAFAPIGGQMPRLGDLYRITQTLSGSYTNNRNFSLLADPALRLAYPQQNTGTTYVNGVVTTTSTDTIQALSQVTVKGYVCDGSGTKLNTFNGTVYPTVYDKLSNLTTLGNDGVAASPPMNFTLQKNVMYKGKASITNGDFQFTFVVPRDIAYQYGPGKISYYYENGVIDGAGSFGSGKTSGQFMVGGSSTTAPKDVTGPRIKLFLNDSTFIYGGTTNENPRLYAVVFDSSGISTVGNGIGHDLVAVMDNNSSNPSILNDYYTADLNTYRSGKINFPYASLPAGTHTLKLKVWDVYDNSSDAYTEFVVSQSAQLALKHVLNYPNPFTTHTSFFFEDNECCQLLNVEIEIFTVAGKLIKTISTNVNTDGYRSPPIDWDGRDDFGDKIGRGVYVYKISVRSPSGGTQQKLEKLVILN
ncbi:MAG TPA: type IX secretion system sortase PorU [Bacteroidia bacterium]|nr:type IX secretion system sortase PorU [Bacteroidia bacterium]